MEPQHFNLKAFYLNKKFNLRQIARSLPDKLIGEDSSLLTYELGTGYVFLFQFGSVCFFNLEKPARQAFIERLSTVHVVKPQLEETDDFAIEVHPDQPIEVHFDRVSIDTASVEKLTLIALTLAESVALDYFENLVDDLLDKGLGIFEGLRRNGRLRRKQDTYHFLAVSMATKHEIVANLYLHDRPENIWDNEELEHLYEGLFRNFEIEERFIGIESKLKSLQEDMSLLGFIHSGRRTENLELTIVILILVEILLLVWEYFIATH